MQANRDTRKLRTRVGAAFRRLAQGAQKKRAYASTVAFYRATGFSWTKAFA